MITDLTVEHPKKTLWRFALPMFISVMFQQFYNIADSSIAAGLRGRTALQPWGLLSHYGVIMAFAEGATWDFRGGVQALWGKGHRQDEDGCPHGIHCLRRHEPVLTVLG